MYRRHIRNYLQAEVFEGEILPIARSGSEDRYSFAQSDLACKRNCEGASPGR